jgi:hypothetical protein
MQDSRQPGTKRLLLIASAVAYVVLLGRSCYTSVTLNH